MSLDYQRKIRPTPPMPLSGPDITIRHTVNDARLLGIVMLTVGTIVVGVACLDISDARATYLMAGDSVFILLPAVLYIVAAMRIKLGVMTAGMMSMRISILQSAACTLAAVAAATLNHLAVSVRYLPFFVPSFAICFLIPALIAQAVQLQGAINAMRLLPPVQPGFQIHTAPVPVTTIANPIPVLPLAVEPLPVVPIDENGSEGADASLASE